MTAANYQLVAYVFASIVLWMVVAQLVRRQAVIPWVRRLSKGRLAAILRFTYYMGLPYAALVLGVVPARYLGLVGFDQLQTKGPSLRILDATQNVWQFLSQIRDIISLVILNWLPDLDTMSGLALTMLVLLSITWFGYSRLKPGAPSTSEARPPLPEEEATFSVLQVVYQAIHWSFYRSAAWMLTDDLYLGFIGGILLVSVEWMLDPGWMARIRTSSPEEPLLNASLLVATSVIFFFVPNLWLLVPVHWLLATGSRRMMALGKKQIVGNTTGNTSLKRRP